jgi:hypothetical protein
METGESRFSWTIKLDFWRRSALTSLGHQQRNRRLPLRIWGTPRMPWIWSIRSGQLCSSLGSGGWEHIFNHCLSHFCLLQFSWSTLPPTREKMPKTHPSKSHCSKSVTDKKISHSANFSSWESAVKSGEKWLNRLLGWWNPSEKKGISWNDWCLRVLGVPANGLISGRKESATFGWFPFHRLHSSQRSMVEAKHVL